MSNYTTNVGMCRVDFFKPYGKWYTTEAIEFLSEDYDDSSIHAAFQRALKAKLKKEDGSYRYAGMTAVCLAPYNKYSHPLMLLDWDKETPP